MHSGTCHQLIKNFERRRLLAGRCMVGRRMGEIIGRGWGGVGGVLESVIIIWLEWCGKIMAPRGTELE